MRYLVTSLLCVLTLSLTAQDDCSGPDFNNDGQIGSVDLITLLTYYGGEWPLAPEFVCGETIAHHDYAYSTVQIGDQCWFAENCRYLPAVSPSDEGSETEPLYYVHGYQGTDVEAAIATDNFNNYGVLYNFQAATLEGLCPSGWHVPTDLEWTQLTDFLGGESVAGYVMKSTSGWDDNGNGSNSSGFTGLPGGYRGDYYGHFFYINDYAFFGSSSVLDDSHVFSRMLSFNYDFVYTPNNSTRGNAVSTRCIKSL